MERMNGFSGRMKSGKRNKNRSKGNLKTFKKIPQESNIIRK